MSAAVSQQFPFQSMRYMGVTGTNGKTTCAWWLAQLCQRLGRKTGLIGTLGRGVWQHEQLALEPTGYTTPDPALLRGILEDFHQQGVSHVVMEVSSHGLQQRRTRDIRFSAALFTNLSRDHLDYHGDMQRYGAAKAKLFEQEGLQHAVLNLDDAFSGQLMETVRQNPSAPTLYTYSLDNEQADVYLRNCRSDLQGVSATLYSPWGAHAVQAPVIGDYNVSNLLGVITLLCAEGFELQRLLDGIHGLLAPPGRLQRILVQDDKTAAEGLAVFVDYAHTPDALEKVLEVLRRCTHEKIWCVFGCGGNRDAGKRPLMGEVASRLADCCVITSDNPRDEMPGSIIEQIVAGMPDQNCHSIIEDREQAIHYAIEQASVGDVVLLAGKGHEQYQEIRGEKHLFDDVQVAAQALNRRSGRRRA